MKRINTLKKSSFSSPQLLVFILVFAAIGGYLLYRSFAAGPLVATLEAEQMILPTNGYVLTDPSASGGKSAALYSNGTATSTVNFPSAVSSFTVMAKGNQCSGAPTMTVAVDGNNLLTNTVVSSTSWAGYSYTLGTNIGTGTHSYSISFTNDYKYAGKAHGHKTTGACDRNLYVDVTNFFGPTVVTPAPTIAFVVSPTSVTAGSASTLTWNSTNATSCSASGAWSGSQPTSGSISTGALNQNSTYSLICTGAGGSASANATVTVTTTTPPPTTYLFDDEFNGSAGLSPDSSKWVNVDNMQYGGMTYSKAKNAFLDGSGNLDLRVTREAWNGKSYAGGSVGTYQYQTGWPPANIRASWPVPFRYEVRFKMPNVAGAWLGPGWNQNIDRTTSQNIYELDVGESRTTLPTWIGANQHTYLNGSDQAPQSGGGSVTDGRFNWHVVRADATASSVTYYIDGVQVASHYGVSGRFGVQLHNEIADAGNWGSGGAQPDPSDPGPWDMLIDYVRVTAL